MGPLTVFAFALMVVSALAYPAVPQYGGQQLVGQAQQVAQRVYQQVAAIPAYEEPPYEERNYKVYYSVKDDPTYNFQTRTEEKNGKTVTGQYTVLEPTGELRVVNYIADDNGFRADVQNQPGQGPPVPHPGRQGAVYTNQAPVNIVVPSRHH